MIATLSLLGLYNYDPTIFDPLHLPDGIDKQTLIDYIISEGSELPTRYPDPSIFARMVSAWSTRRQNSFARLVRAFSEEYNPLHNFDRHESWTEHAANSSNGTSNTSGTTSGSSTGSDTTTDSATSFNSQSFADTDKTVSGSTSTTTTTDTNTATTTATGENDVIHQGHLYGNIGITTSQQMLRDQVDVSQMDIYQIIGDDFIDAFCVGIY